MLPDFPMIGVWQIDTGSFNSIVNVNSGLDLLRTIKGRISMVLVDLVLIPKETMDPVEKKKQTIYCLDIRLPVSLRNLGQLETFNAAGLLPPPPDTSAPVGSVPFIDSDESPVTNVTATVATPATPPPAAPPIPEAPPAIAEHVRRYWNEWLALKKEHDLDDYALEEAKDVNQCDQFKFADEATCALIIKYVRERAIRKAAQAAAVPVTATPTNGTPAATAAPDLGDLI
jgi:hypothetical protein